MKRTARQRRLGIVPFVPFLGNRRRGLGLTPDQHLDRIEARLLHKEARTLATDAEVALADSRCDIAILKYGTLRHLFGWLHAHRESSGQPERFASQLERLERDTLVEVGRAIIKKCRS